MRYRLGEIRLIPPKQVELPLPVKQDKVIEPPKVEAKASSPKVEKPVEVSVDSATKTTTPAPKTSPE